MQHRRHWLKICLERIPGQFATRFHNFHNLSRSRLALNLQDLEQRGLAALSCLGRLPGIVGWKASSVEENAWTSQTCWWYKKVWKRLKLGLARGASLSSLAQCGLATKGQQWGTGNYWLSCDHGQLVRSTEWCAVQSQDFSDFDMIWYDSVFGLLWKMLPRYPRPLRALIEIRWVHPLDRVFSGAQLSPDGTVQVHGRQRIHCRWQCEPWLQYLGRNQGGGDDFVVFPEWAVKQFIHLAATVFYRHWRPKGWKISSTIMPSNVKCTY